MTALEAYALVGEDLPEGFRETARVRVSNVELAVRVEDPDLVRLILDRKRIDGLEQDLVRTSSSTEVTFHVEVALFADEQGARDELAAPVVPAGLAAVDALCHASSRSASSIAHPLMAQALEFRSESPTGEALTGLALRFAVGRVVGIVSAIGRDGEALRDELYALACALERRLHRTTPPPLTARELERLAAQSRGEAILFDAYALLLQFHHRRFAPRDLLDAAFRSARARVGEASSASLPAPATLTATDPAGAWTDFLESYRALSRAAARSVGEQALAHAAARGMYGGKDLHTAFLDPPLFRRFVALSRGRGRPSLGMTVSIRPPHWILRVLPGSPAELGGLRAGDEVITADGRPACESLGVLARGLDGSPLSVTVRRPDRMACFTTTLTAPPVEARLVQHRLLPSGIGLVELNALPRGDEATQRLREAFEAFEAAGANGWIVDFRYNGGGWARTMCEVAGLFVGEGSLLTTQYLPHGGERRQHSLGEPLPMQRPLAILIGPATASGAEVIAESLRAHGRAVLVGARSAGSVNGGRHFALMDGSGVRIAELDLLVGPERRTVEDVGVQPDFSVDLSPSMLTADHDAQLAAAERAVAALVHAQ